jgi:hypothetical protein
MQPQETTKWESAEITLILADKNNQEIPFSYSFDDKLEDNIQYFLYSSRVASSFFEARRLADTYTMIVVSSHKNSKSEENLTKGYCQSIDIEE